MNSSIVDRMTSVTQRTLSSLHYYTANEQNTMNGCFYLPLTTRLTYTYTYTMYNITYGRSRTLLCIFK